MTNPCHKGSESRISVAWKDGTQTRRCACGNLFTARGWRTWRYVPPKEPAKRRGAISTEDYLP